MPNVAFVRHAAGFVHGSAAMLASVVATGAPGGFVATDVPDVTALDLTVTDVVVFFTSGELPMDETQKTALLDFVRGGGGFIGIHSATDTFYDWPDYGELIGARFDGHPWTEEVTIDVAMPTSDIVEPLAPAFVLTDEIYQFREFDSVGNQVLLRLDASSVDLAAPDVRATDFPLAWVRSFGEGRVFYLALGHFDAVVEDPRFLGMLGRAVEWTAPRCP